MDKQLVKEYRDRWEAVAAIELEEQRSASVDQRWRQLNAILQLARGLGLSPAKPDDETVYRRWARLKGDQV